MKVTNFLKGGQKYGSAGASWVRGKLKKPLGIGLGTVAAVAGGGLLVALTRKEPAQFSPPEPLPEPDMSMAMGDMGGAADMGGGRNWQQFVEMQRAGMDPRQMRPGMAVNAGVPDVAIGAEQLGGGAPSRG